jgi:hypothetical protein
VTRTSWIEAGLAMLENVVRTPAPKRPLYTASCMRMLANLAWHPTSWAGFMDRVFDLAITLEDTLAASLMQGLRVLIRSYRYGSGVDSDAPHTIDHTVSAKVCFVHRLGLNETPN